MEVKTETLNSAEQVEILSEFASKLNGIKYGYPIISNILADEAKEKDIVIVYGMSDDLMEFDGAIEDEVGVFGGGDVFVNKDGIVEKGSNGIRITALWNNRYAWCYDTNIPHKTFVIYDEGIPYCEGIVFSINDIK